MGNSDDGRLSGKGGQPKPASRLPPGPGSLAGPQISLSRRKPSSFTRLVAFGSWLLVFLLLAALLKGINEWRLHRLKNEVKALQARPLPETPAPKPAVPPDEPVALAETAELPVAPPAIPAPPPPVQEPRTHRPLPGWPNWS